MLKGNKFDELKFYIKTNDNDKEMLLLKTHAFFQGKPDDNDGNGDDDDDDDENIRLTA
jgi:hypothetical protein